MNKLDDVSKVIVMFWIGMLFAVFSVILSGCDGSLNEAQIAQAEAERARAEAEHAQIQVEIEQTRLAIEEAKADLELAKGQRKIYEAAARSIDSDRQLTEYYAHRGDQRATLFMVSLVGFMACGVGFVYVMRRYENEKSKNDTENE